MNNFFEKSKAHPGFKAVASQIAKKQGISTDRASAILAASTRHAGKSARRANPRLNRVKKSMSLGDLFEAAKMIPRMLHGGYDWDAPKKPSFVMIRIERKHSPVDGRYVVLERREDGKYRIAKKTRDKEKDVEGKIMEKLEKDSDDLDKGFGTSRLRSPRRTPSKATSRRFTSFSATKSLEKLKNALEKHFPEQYK